MCTPSACVPHGDGVAIRDRGEEGVLRAGEGWQRFAVDPLQRLQPALIADGGAVVDDIGCGDLVKDRQVGAIDALLVEAADDGQILFGRRGRTIGRGRGRLRRGLRREQTHAPQEHGQCDEQADDAVSVAMHELRSSIRHVAHSRPLTLAYRRSGPAELAIKDSHSNQHEQRGAVRPEHWWQRVSARDLTTLARPNLRLRPGNR